MTGIRVAGLAIGLVLMLVQPVPPAVADPTCISDTTKTFAAGFVSNAWKLTRLDPCSGEVTEIGSYPQIQSWSAGLSAVDWDTGRYFMVGSGAPSVINLFVIDITSGKLLSSAAFPPRLVIGPIEYDHRSKRLFGHIYDSDAKIPYFSDIEPASASVTFLQRAETPIAAAVSALDEEQSRYFYVWSSPSGPRLVTVDTRSGRAISNVALPNDVNAATLQFDRSRRKLVGILWIPG